MTKRIHPAWIVAGITFLTLIASAGTRSAPSVLIVPLEESFGWGRDEITIPKYWDFKSSKSMDLEFMRMAEKRSKLTH